MFRVLVTAAATAALMTAAPAAAIVYSIDIGDATLGATGFIETDGTIGTLGSANIVDWEFNLKDNGTDFTLNGPTNSQLLLDGNDLSATAGGLFFNFSGSGFALFQNPITGSGINFICFTAVDYCAGTPLGVHITTDTYGDAIPLVGLQQIGTAAITGGVPEPASWAMLIAGFGLVGAVSRRKAALAA